MKALARTILAAALIGAVAFAVPGCADEDDTSPDQGGEEIPEQDGLEVGEEAPDFRLKNQEQATVALSDYSGVNNVILVFYPLAFTPV